MLWISYLLAYSCTRALDHHETGHSDVSRKQLSHCFLAGGPDPMGSADHHYACYAMRHEDEFLGSMRFPPTSKE
jgi:hypothetical protein